MNQLDSKWKTNSILKTCHLYHRDGRLGRGWKERQRETVCYLVTALKHLNSYIFYPVSYIASPFPRPLGRD